jgi:hypothetical protein
LKNVVDQVADDLFESTKGAVEDAWPTVRHWLSVVMLAGWSAFWLLILGIGYLVGWPPMLFAPLIVLALTFTTVAYRRHRRKKRLAARAKVSLVARAQLRQLKLERPMQAALSAFDHHYARVHRQLSAPDLAQIDIGLKIEAELERARDLMFDLAVTESQLHEELNGLRGARSVSSVVSARDELRNQITGVGREADKVALDVQKIGERLGAMKQLSGGNEPAIKQRSLEDVLEDLDRTAAAYKEIDEDRLERMRAKAAQLARTAREGS